ncbi:hypothetical protein [Palleronia sp.]|uniref:hypothetical protein n=1 Tax=Palleronia sp. TaxID=1940284 RepID=UPI0035C7DA73
MLFDPSRTIPVVVFAERARTVIPTRLSDRELQILPRRPIGADFEAVSYDIAQFRTGAVRGMDSDVPAVSDNTVTGLGAVPDDHVCGLGSVD